MSNDLNEAARSSQREVSYFDVPEEIKRMTGVSSIGMIELSADEELMATKRCFNDAMRLTLELSKEALRFVDEKPLNTGDGSADAFWSKNTRGFSYLRQLILSAYNEIHNPKRVHVENFLTSRRITVK